MKNKQAYMKMYLQLLRNKFEREYIVYTLKTLK